MKQASNLSQIAPKKVEKSKENDAENKEEAGANKKKKELKAICKELEKKKRKLIKAAKQRYLQKQQNEKGRVFPQTHIENVQELDASLLPNVSIPQFFKSAANKIYEIGE